MTQSTKLAQLSSHSSCAVIVAHPDDETIWAGGTIFMHPQVNWTIVTLCRKSDPDRAPKFFKALEKLNAAGAMGGLDDGPDQNPLNPSEVQNAIMQLLPTDSFDLIITHNARGEYTRHRRHEEAAQAVLALWQSGKLSSPELLTFAYEDAGGNYLPKAVQTADILIELPSEIWQKKYDIITNIYGFSEDSFEAKTTPRKEAFFLKLND